MTSEVWLPGALSVTVGVMLGLFFFAGLWWTVRRAVISPRPALWFFGSMLIRVAVTLVGFYWVSADQWWRLAAVHRWFHCRSATGLTLCQPSGPRQEGTMQLSSDAVIFWHHGWVNLNLTIVVTWVLMAVLAGGSWLLTRGLAQRDHHTRLQALLEMIVIAMVDLLKESGLRPARHYLPLIGTLFLFIALSNLLVIIPGYQAPTGSLSTTTALAVVVFVAVPFYGIRSQGGTRLSGLVSEAGVDHAAVQPDRRAVTHPGPGRAPVR